MIDLSALPYRACVGIALFNAEGKLFAGERMEHEGAWQLPQGGIDEGETLEDAFFREMREEIGSDQADILRIHDKVFRYDFPDFLQHKLYNGRYRGQEQTWVAARFTGQDSDIDIYAHTFPEFRSWEWISPAEMLNRIVSFKRTTYEEIMYAFRDIADPSTR
ncbi:MAG: RNA pyrophosphohydrolase [Alphaproteobacteria bacterium]|nr:RNA pyrophosphohydrolase [Alphaproteobacteria bacterium]